MFVPPAFRFTDHAAQVAFMQRYSFATLVTGSGPKPIATHLPFVVAVEGERVRLLSHVAKVNAQWRELAAGPALVIFSEPHAYVSPVHYEQERSVPTWNYVAVHAYGPADIITDPAHTLVILEQTIAYYEPAYQAQWARLPADYKTNMAAALVAFDIEVTEVQAQQKLSQNKTAAERARIQAALAGSPEAAGRDLAAYMAAAAGKTTSLAPQP